MPVAFLLSDFLTRSRYCLIKRNTEASTSHPALKLELYQESSVDNIKEIIIIIIIVTIIIMTIIKVGLSLHVKGMNASLVAITFFNFIDFLKTTCLFTGIAFTVLMTLMHFFVV
jgi:hypothetical protein